MNQSGVEQNLASFGLTALPENGAGSADSKSPWPLPAQRTRWIVACGDFGLANDYLRFQHQLPQLGNAATCELLSPEALLQEIGLRDTGPLQVVLFVSHRTGHQLLKIFAGLSQLASRVPVSCLIVVPSLLNHLCPQHDDGLQVLLAQFSDAFHKSASQSITSAPGSVVKSTVAENTESYAAVGRAATSRLILLRTGYVLSESSAMTGRLARLRKFRLFAGPQLTTTFVTGEKLFSTINAELAPCVSDPRKTDIPVNATIADSEPHVRHQRQSWNRLDSEHNAPHAHVTRSEAGCNPRAADIRELTLLGTRRSWQAVLSESCPVIPGKLAERLLSALFRCLGIQWIAFLLIRILSLFLPSMRQVHFDTLKPRTVREIISLYNRHNCRDVQLAGYNNGVNHFGWTFPEKTVVLTTGLPGRMQLSDKSILDLKALSTIGREHESDTDSANNPVMSGAHFTVDAGLTLKQCIGELNRLNREFYVVPNYSWISMGTVYFVPVHGSGSHVSTLGDTIEDVLLYDAENEQFIFARRGDRLFRESMYVTDRHLLLLRLTFRVKPKSVYSVRAETVQNASAEDVLRIFDDTDASNVEIRRNRASNTSIDVRRYYVDSATTVPGAMELPRDRIGRVWDRLEETPIVSTLFHWAVRRFAFHVELFLRADEFAIFWKHVPQLPVSKIQLRQMLKDGITNSACASENCISADLFMMKSKRDAFLRFVNTNLPNVRFNPGKQSAGGNGFRMPVSTADQ